MSEITITNTTVERRHTTGDGARGTTSRRRTYVRSAFRPMQHGRLRDFVAALSAAGLNDVTSVHLELCPTDGDTPRVDYLTAVIEVDTSGPNDPATPVPDATPVDIHSLMLRERVALALAVRVVPGDDAAVEAVLSAFAGWLCDEAIRLRDMGQPVGAYHADRMAAAALDRRRDEPPVRASAGAA